MIARLSSISNSKIGVIIFFADKSTRISSFEEYFPRKLRSWACPGVSIRLKGLPKASTSTWVFRCLILLCDLPDGLRAVSRTSAGADGTPSAVASIIMYLLS